MPEPKKIGWIGLGKMGLPMAQNLLRAGWPVVVYNRSPKSTAALAAQGAATAATPSGVGKACGTVFTMVSDDTALEQVTLGTDGVIGAMAPGSILVDMSTVSSGVSTRIAERARNHSVGYLRAPVSGGTGLAIAGRLTILVSGGAAEVETCHPILEKLGAKIFHVGLADEARTMKLALNLMVGATAAMLGESLALCEKAGLDWNVALDVIANSVIASPLVSYKIEPLRRRDFTSTFSAIQMAKDFRLILDAAKARGIDLPVAENVNRYWAQMIAQGHGEDDFVGCLSVIEGNTA